MTDNYTTNPGSGGATFGSDFISSVHYPRFKLVLGADGANDGDVSLTNAVPVRILGDPARGLTMYRNINLGTADQAVKATAGTVYFLHWNNRATSQRFLKFYNDTTANVVVGTTTPVLTFVLEPNSGETTSIPHGLYFSTAITIAATTGIADSDTGAPGTNEVVVNIGYI